jgi:NCS1 family nucleobase:cation symporter-1
VLVRASFGTVGANIPAMLRAVVACGWFGINAWIGGAALQTFFTALWPGWQSWLGTSYHDWFFAALWPGWSDMLGHSNYPFDHFANTQWISFALFWLLNIVIIFRGMDLLRRVERFAAPYVLVMTALLVGWAIHRAGGLGPILERSSFVPTKEGATLAGVMIPALTGTIAFWSTLSLNMPDFTRFGRSQREQVVGQAYALPSTMTVFAAMSIMITSATAVIYGAPVSDPIALGGMFGSRLLVGIAMFTAVIATLAVNIAANVVSPANDFANAFPKRINFARGGLITGIIGVAMMPWELLKDADRYINGWLGGYGAALGSVGGVLVIDYWVLRKTKLDLRSLYVPDGAYQYTGGWNMAAVIATLVGAGTALLGAFWEPMKPLYDWSWFVGFGLAAAIYYAAMRKHPHLR